MPGTTTVSLQYLRHHGGPVLDRVARGESITITRDGTPAAELRPLRRRSPTPAELIARARQLPQIDPAALRRDIDTVVDQAL